MKTHLNKAHTTPEQWQTDMMFARLEKTDPDRKLEVLIDTFKEFCGELRNSQQNLKKNFEAVEKGIQGLQAYAPQNLLLNPRFKAWTSGATANPDGWTGVASDTPQQVVPVIQGISAEGYACRMGMGDSKVQAVSCKPSTVYMLSLWIGNTNAGAGWVSLFDNGATPRTTQYDIVTHTLSGYQWKRVIIPITTASDATTLTVSANCTAAAVRICELYLHEGKYDMPSITNDLWSRLTELQNTVNTLTVDADTLDTHDSTEFPILVPGGDTVPPYTPPPTGGGGGIWQVPEVSPPGAGMTGTPKGGMLIDPADDKLKVNVASPPTAPNFKTVPWSTDIVTDHGGLTGLSDDDHSIYHNNARGDLRYPILPQPAESGNFVGLSGTAGQLADSGYTHTDFAVAVHTHSKLVASDGSPDPAVNVDAAGFVGIGQSVPTEMLHVEGSVGSNGDVTALVKNTNSGGQGRVSAMNSAENVCQIGMFGSSQAAYGAIAAGEAYLYSSQNITLMAGANLKVIKFATSGTTETARIDASGNISAGPNAPVNRFHANVNATSTAVNSQFTNNSSGHTATDGLLVGLRSDNTAQVNIQDQGILYLTVAGSNHAKFMYNGGTPRLQFPDAAYWTGTGTGTLTMKAWDTTNRTITGFLKIVDNAGNLAYIPCVQV